MRTKLHQRSLAYCIGINCQTNTFTDFIFDQHKNSRKTTILPYYHLVIADRGPSTFFNGKGDVL